MLFKFELIVIDLSNKLFAASIRFSSFIVKLFDVFKSILLLIFEYTFGLEFSFSLSESPNKKSAFRFNSTSLSIFIFEKLEPSSFLDLIKSFDNLKLKSFGLLFS